MKVICNKAKECSGAHECDHAEPHTKIKYCEFECAQDSDSKCVPVMYIAS